MNEMATNAAARGGHFAVLRWAVEEGGCTLTEETCLRLVQNGSLDMLRWARVEKHVEWDERSICMEAATYGQLHILQWMFGDREAACRLSLLMQQGFTKRLYMEAAYFGHLHVLRWLHRRHQQQEGEKDAWKDACICRDAAKSGKLEVLQWLKKKGCPWDAAVCSVAAEYGHLKVLQWARANGCPWSEDACAAAALYGRLHMLKWLRKNGCPWDDRTVAVARTAGFQEIVEWALANGCPEQIT